MIFWCALLLALPAAIVAAITHPEPNYQQCIFTGFPALTYAQSASLDHTRKCWPGFVEGCTGKGYAKLQAAVVAEGANCVFGGVAYCQEKVCRESVCPLGYGIFELLDDAPTVPKVAGEPVISNPDPLRLSFACKFVLDPGCVIDCEFASEINLPDEPVLDNLRCHHLSGTGNDWTYSTNGQLIYAAGVRTLFLQIAHTEGCLRDATEANAACKSSATLANALLTYPYNIGGPHTAGGKFNTILEYRIYGYGTATNPLYRELVQSSRDSEDQRTAATVGTYCQCAPKANGDTKTICQNGATPTTCPFNDATKTFTCPSAPTDRACQCPSCPFPFKGTYCENNDIADKCCLFQFMDQYSTYTTDTCFEGQKTGADVFGTFSLNNILETSPLREQCWDVNGVGSAISICCPDGTTCSSIQCSAPGDWTGTPPTCPTAAATCQNVIVNPYDGAPATGEDPTQTTAVGTSVTTCAASTCTATTSTTARTAFATAMWTPVPDACPPGGCTYSTLPHTIANGKLMTSLRTVAPTTGTSGTGISVTLVCNTGYGLIGTQGSCIASCIDGAWVGLTGLTACSCQPLGCQALPEISTHLTWTYTPNTPTNNMHAPNTVAASGCQTLVCLVHLWVIQGTTEPEADIDLCPNTCPAITPICEGTHYYSGSGTDDAPVADKTTVRMVCNPGYYPNPAATISSPYVIKCNAGTWSASVTDFQAICLPYENCCTCLANPSKPDEVTYADGADPVIKTATATQDTCPLTETDLTLECSTCSTAAPYAAVWNGQFECA